MIMIIDNHSEFIKKFKRGFLCDHDYDHIVLDNNEPINFKEKDKIKGIILSGGRGNPYEPLNLTTNFVALMNYNVPIIGLCLGFEIIAVAYGGRIKKLEKHQDKREQISIIEKNDPIFKDIDSEEISIREKHGFYVSTLPEDFEVLGSSDICKYEIIKHRERPIYGFQGHPEVSGVDGMKIMKNFLDICMESGGEK
jgi:GMP synthase (glutamine-hydrolysing)